MAKGRLSGGLAFILAFACTLLLCANSLSASSASFKASFRALSFKSPRLQWVEAFSGGGRHSSPSAATSLRCSTSGAFDQNAFDWDSAWSAFSSDSLCLWTNNGTANAFNPAASAAAEGVAAVGEVPFMRVVRLEGARPRGRSKTAQLPPPSSPVIDPLLARHVKLHTKHVLPRGPATTKHEDKEQEELQTPGLGEGSGSATVAMRRLGGIVKSDRLSVGLRTTEPLPYLTGARSGVLHRPPGGPLAAPRARRKSLVSVSLLMLLGEERSPAAIRTESAYPMADAQKSVSTDFSPVTILLSGTSRGGRARRVFSGIGLRCRDAACGAVGAASMLLALAGGGLLRAPSLYSSGQILPPQCTEVSSVASAGHPAARGIIDGTAILIDVRLRTLGALAEEGEIASSGLEVARSGLEYSVATEAST